jgi:hypothetical protein
MRQGQILKQNSDLNVVIGTASIEPGRPCVHAEIWRGGSSPVKRGRWLATRKRRKTEGVSQFPASRVWQPLHRKSGPPPPRRKCSVGEE